MFRLRPSKILSNEATDAGIVTLKTLSTRVVICVGKGRKAINGLKSENTSVNIRSFSHLVESDYLFERRANLWQGLKGRVAQALARLTPAAPTEQEQHGQGDAYESGQ
eukprot:scaffold127375_cov69-Phaeocystis_antarctica.AAC.1